MVDYDAGKCIHNGYNKDHAPMVLLQKWDGRMTWLFTEINRTVTIFHHSNI